ncbi:epidermal growth factor receptor kinase substrate 8-like protein 2 isoform X2 [Liolophura sinensis]|uniref:epidermal growth factor receptor kinase substrate 8-like protein 2 isoform X2 n=1 Tax=Liolophura sinensis TaxID=3198878 RepID=UPI0031583783
MPGVMHNGYDYDDRSRAHPHPGGGSSYDAYRRNDDRREEYFNDLYAKPQRNGYSSQNDRFNWTDHVTDRSSLDGRHDVYKGHEPVYEVDHLATFTATRRGSSGLISLEEGLSKLRNMEVMTGIWTMRCLMVIERNYIIILDNQTGDEHDRFPIDVVHKPTAIVRNDPREIYNNLILFTVVTDPRKGAPEPNMHIFQSVSASAQEIADEVHAAKEGKPRLSQGHHRIPPAPVKPAPEPPHMLNSDPRPLSGMYNMRSRPQVNRDREDTDSMQGERIELDMQKLNACCDDIEKFVARLQQAAEAYKELENRKKERGKAKSKQVGDGMLSMRAKPPRNDDFIDIFQKFKYAFNILARLKPYIHDPNAPELVHFLFTPLSLIYEASRDVNNPPPLASRAVSPLLTREAKDLLLNCLTSKEQEFWMSLGDAWFMTREQWRGSVPPYMPRFYNGWQPAPSDIDEDPRGAMNQAVVAQMAQIRHRNELDLARDKAANQVLSYPPVEERFPRPYTDRRDDPIENFSTRLPTPPPGALGGDPRVVGYQENKRIHDDRGIIPSSSQTSMRPHPRDDAQLLFARDLKARGAKVYEVVHRRQGKNAKELTVDEGDILEVLEDTRNWWRLRNYLGEVGHAPYTILREYKDEDNGYDDRMPERNFEAEQLHKRTDSGGYSAHLPSFGDYGSAIQPPSSAQYPANSNNNNNYQNSRQGRREDDWPVERRPTPPPAAPVPEPPPPPTVITPLYDNPPASPKPVRKKHSPKNHDDKKDDLHDELQARMSHILIQNKSRFANRDVRITQHSSPEEVTEWLIGKQFSATAVNEYREYTGADMFNLKRQEMERHLGREEGARLDSQLKVQRNISGYATKSAAELKAILQRRKEWSDSGGADPQTQDRLGNPPTFSPGPLPDLSATNSEADSEELMGSLPANTLRDMLRRQRQKIFEEQFDQP